jgi:methylmalonyl-CoA mutase N-terminal domain/subunit
MKEIKHGYFSKIEDDRTWSGYPVKIFYTEEDLKTKDKSLPGEFPYTRGIYRDMYRGRLWTMRAVCGFGTPEETNERFRFLFKEGETGLDVIFDIPTMTGIDADHPDVRDEVGVQGTSLCSLPDMEEMMDGIPLDKVSSSLVITSYASPVILAFYIALAQKMGIDIKNLRGTIQNDPLHHRFCGYPEEFTPTELCLKTATDIIEFCTKNMPLFYPQNINAYDLRENGLNAAQEIAFSFGMAMAYIDACLKRGLKIDEFGPRIAFYCSAHIDIFEEVAKFRAMRRMWAKLMKEKYGAKDERTLKFKFGVHTAGCSLVPQEPLNNIIRVAYEALAAVLGGVQSLHCCAYDEPLALPTEESARIALRTQQILAYETGVGRCADPLGGSYYVEYLTDKLEEEANKILEEIMRQGGMVNAIKSGWVQREIDNFAYQYQREVMERKRLIVGMNIFRSEAQGKPIPVHRISKKKRMEQIRKIKNLRKTRSKRDVLDALSALKSAAKDEKNLIPYIVDCAKVYCTMGEIMGVIREAYGMRYDPLGKLQSPLK